MRKNIKGEYVIFSLRPIYSLPAIISTLGGLEYTKVAGQWDGKKESSVLMRMPDSWEFPQYHNEALQAIAKILWLAAEDSFLYITAGDGRVNGRDALLMSTDPNNPTIEDMGKLICVPKETAEKVNHTCIYGNYYTTQKTMEGYNNG